MSRFEPTEQCPHCGATKETMYPRAVVTVCDFCGKSYQTKQNGRGRNVPLASSKQSPLVSDVRNEVWYKDDAWSLSELVNA